MPIFNDRYNNNPYLPKAGTRREYSEHEILEIKKCYEDPVYLAKTYFKIVSLDKGLINFDLYDFQEEAIRTFQTCRNMIINASRQAGKTSIATVILLHTAIYNRDKTIAILANKAATAREILERIQRAYEYLPDFLKPGVKTWNKGSVEFENGSKIVTSSSSADNIRGKSCITGDTRVCLLEEETETVFYVEVEKVINTEFVNIKKENTSVNPLYTIYRTTNKINGKIYIGFHSLSKDYMICDYNDSGSIFYSGYLGSGKLIRRAIEKYGPENFSQEILGVFKTKEDAEAFERTLVDRNFVESQDNYNLSIGGNVCILYGENNGFYGKKHTKETLDHIRKKTEGKREYNVKLYDTETGTLFKTFKQFYDFYNIDHCDRNRFTVYLYVYYGICYTKSIRHHKIMMENIEILLDKISKRDETKKIRGENARKRFKGKKRTEEAKRKGGESIKEWIKENPEAHADRMTKINKNPDKIRKTAEKHRGMKRSEETRRKLAEKARGRTPSNKGKIVIINLYTHEKKLIEKSDSIPDGWIRGMKIKNENTI